MTLRKRLKRGLRYLLIVGLAWAMGRLPLSWARRVGAFLGSVFFHVASGERRKALHSLGIAFPNLPGEERYDLAHRAFRHLGVCAFELACFRQMDAEMEKHVEWPKAARDVLEEALARKKGVLFVTGHVGHWEFLARRIALAGYPCQAIAREMDDERLARLIEKFRASAGLRSIWRGKPGVIRHMLRSLRGGEILGLLIDQDTRAQSVFVPFFGKLAATPRAVADLAMRTGASVVLGFCMREEGRYVVSMEAVPLPSTTDKEKACLELTTTLTLGIENVIRKHPEQWVWMHSRWKTRPPESC